MKKWMLILSCLFLSLGFSFAQSTQISGTVVDDIGEPVTGASVVVKGTNVGTITGIDGKFSINLPKGSKTLVFSLIGMNTVEHEATPNMRVVMEDDTQLLEEVVITAMGITREKKALGYAAQGVSAADLNQTGNTNLSSALQGKVSGVQITPSSGMPGASSQIVIRGARSFDGNNTPLYIIDGMPIASTPDVDTGQSVTGTDFSNRAIDIDPANIESIEVLKGQAASALYGIRASNGVVIITTKSGKNLKKGKPQITLNSTLSFEKISRKLEVQKKYAQGTGGAYSHTSSLSWGPLISELPNDAKYGGNTSNGYTQFGAQLHAGKYYVPQRASAGMDPWTTPGWYDNFDQFLQTGSTWNNSINIAQGLENGSYSLFLSSANQEGIVPSTGMDRYTLGFNANTNLSNNWSTGFSGSFISGKIKKAPSANTGLLATMYGAPASYDMKGIPSNVEGNPYVQNAFRGGSFENPYWAIKNDKFQERTSRFFGNGFINYNTKLNSTDKKLNLKYQLGVDAYTTNYIDMWGYGSRQTNSQRGKVDEYERKNLVFNSLFVANFNWNITNDWNLNVIAGNEFIGERLDKLDAYGDMFNFAGWNHIKNATNQINSSSVRSKRSIGFFGEASASYRNMVYLGVTGRNDMVSYMPRDNRSFFYPSVNASFVFTELASLKDQRVLNFGKIRASYAEVGQAGDYIENYYYKPTYGSGFYTFAPLSYPLNNVTPFVPYFVAFDPNLKPQNTRSYEFGVDLSFFDKLFDLSYTYSRQNVKDQIFQVPLSGSTGLNSLLTNGGEMKTDAHEITLNVNPVNTKLVDWSIGFNWTKITNNVVKLAPGVESIFLGGFVTPQVRAQAGTTFPVIYGVDYARDDKGRVLVDSDGMPFGGETTVIGKVSPDFILGINTKLRIEKLIISAVFDWKSGGQMYAGTYGVMGVYGTRKDTENRDKPLVFNGYKSDGTKNDIEVLPDENYYNTLNSIDASSVLNSSYFKLRELSLSYPVYKTAGLDVGINAFARNILIWTNLKYFDPEASQGNNNMAGGFERFSLPSASSYGFGVNVKF